MIKYVLYLGMMIVALSCSLKAGSQDYTIGDVQFTLDVNLTATPVKDQYKTETCWSFSGISLIESELIRMGKGEIDLSEMFVVRNVYLEKADKYIRMHGHNNFAGGGELFDVFNCINKYGIVPEEVYSGLPNNEGKPNHFKMDMELKECIELKVKDIENDKFKGWKNDFVKKLDSFLGDYKDTFIYNNIAYTSRSFFEYLGIKPDDYLIFGSYTHHPFYTKFSLEIPDNWSWQEIWNLPLDEMVEVVDYALKNGISVGWTADVTEDRFCWKKGYAVLDDSLFNNTSGSCSNKLKPAINDIIITQEMRQKAFNNFKTTDDHGMHIVGYAKDQNGNNYYYVKNSWGVTPADCSGYLFASENYFKYKTIFIMLHKDGIPDNISRKIHQK